MECNNKSVVQSFVKYKEVHMCTTNFDVTLNSESAASICRVTEASEQVDNSKNKSHATNFTNNEC